MYKIYKRMSKEERYYIIKYKKRDYSDQKENIKSYMEKNKEKIKEQRRERYKNDTEYREKIKEKRRERYKKDKKEKEKNNIMVNYQDVIRSR